ncbi:MAG: BolA family protein [Pseudomonadota bacterium]
MSSERSTRIHELLQVEFSPQHLLVKDQSHLHAGHAGAEDGKGHFAVTIVSDAFEGKTRIQRHRIIFDALGDMMHTDIHALSITARTPAE